MEPRIKAISYYSRDAYEAEAMKLRESAHKYSVEIDMLPMPPFGSWEQGVMFKPQYIANKLLEIKGLGYDGLLWTDADSVFVRKVPWSELEGAQLGYTRFQWSPNHKNEILTGTMYFANDDKVRVLVDEWVRMTPNFKSSFTPEQDAFAVLMDRWKGLVFVKNLSSEWATINDPEAKKLYDPKSIPIVMHNQFSRTFRKQEAIEKTKPVKAKK